MRFITEFKVDELECDLPGHPSASYRREVCNNKLGNLIGEYIMAPQKRRIAQLLPIA